MNGTTIKKLSILHISDGLVTWGEGTTCEV